jgi:hypothetical protein
VLKDLFEVVFQGSDRKSIAFFGDKQCLVFVTVKDKRADRYPLGDTLDKLIGQVKLAVDPERRTISLGS